MVNYLLPFGLLLGLVLFALPIDALLSRFFRTKSLLILLTALVTAPILLGELLYLLLYLAPGRGSSFYLSFVGLFVALALAFFRRPIAALPSFLASLANRAQSRWQPLDGVAKVLLGSVGLMIILIIIRMLFWPINWADQIFYVEQAYVFAATRSLTDFMRWDVFRDSLIVHQMNPAIRPGLPMIFSFLFLATKSLIAGQFFAQLVVLYYFFLAMALIFYTTVRASFDRKLKNGLTALFFTLTTFLFVSHTIYGFKEILEICLVLLIVNLAVGLNLKENHRLWLVIGVLMGLMSFVNYSGIIISVILLVILLIVFENGYLLAITNGAKALLLLAVLSGFELAMFIKWLITGTSVGNAVSADLLTANTLSTSSAIAGHITPVSYSAREFYGYGINSLADLYIKGKFQGIFQFQYYGLVFILFVLTAIFTFRRQLATPVTKLIMFFVLLYAFVFFDPFNLDRNQYGYVLSVSFKYTVLLVPFVSVLIGWQSGWLEGWIGKIRAGVIGALAAVYLLADLLLVRRHYDQVLGLIGRIMPLHSDPSHYLYYLRLGDNIVTVLATILLAFILVLRGRRISEVVWQRYQLSYGLFLVCLFLVPCLFFFNTNLSLAKTFRYALAPKATKLANVNGWEDLYGMVNDINSLPKGSKVLFLGQSLELLELHLNDGVSNIQDGIESLPTDTADAALVSSQIKKNDYIFTVKSTVVAGVSIDELSYLRPVSARGTNVLYQVVSN